MSIGNDTKIGVNPAWQGFHRRDRLRVMTDASKGGRTKQEFAEECDLNVLMKRYEKTGVPPSFKAVPPRYVDAADMPDFQTCLQVVADAERQFMALPARVRSEFENDPAKFVEFASDPANLDQMRKWGLAEPAPVPPEPVEVKVVGDPLVKPAE